MASKNSLCEKVTELRESSREIIRELGFLETKNHFVNATSPQIHALIEIGKHGMLTVAELARILNLNQSSTCRTLMEMKKLGWVAPLSLPNDRKQKPLQLTSEGKEKLAQINSTCGSVYQQALERLSLQDQSKVVEAFCLFSKALYEVRQESVTQVI